MKYTVNKKMNRAEMQDLKCVQLNTEETNDW